MVWAMGFAMLMGTKSGRLWAGPGILGYAFYKGVGQVSGLRTGQAG